MGMGLIKLSAKVLGFSAITFYMVTLSSMSIADSEVETMLPSNEYTVETGQDEGMYVYEFIPKANKGYRCIVTKYGMDCILVGGRVSQ